MLLFATRHWVLQVELSLHEMYMFQPRLETYRNTVLTGYFNSLPHITFNIYVKRFMFMNPISIIKTELVSYSIRNGKYM